MPIRKYLNNFVILSFYKVWQIINHKFHNLLFKDFSRDIKKTPEYLYIYIYFKKNELRNFLSINIFFCNIDSIKCIILPFNDGRFVISGQIFCRAEFKKSFRKGQNISKATKETPCRTFHSNGGAKLENYVIMRDVTSYMKQQKVPVKCEKLSRGEVIEYAANE